MTTLNKLKTQLKSYYNKEASLHAQRFFKTGKGEYGEGDIFLGLKVPLQRSIAKDYTHLTLENIKTLLYDKIHEFRFCALVILCNKYKKANEEKQRKVLFDFYIKHAKQVNNWDLVDISCPTIVGQYLLNIPKERKILYKLAKSRNLWEKRISIVSTMTFIRKGELHDCFKLCELLMSDSHDLMHKACGWMLREVGKQDEQQLTNFLNKYIKQLPRTTLRYAIERYPEKKRKEFLKK